MLRLLTAPIRLGLSITGRVLDEVRSAVTGSTEFEPRSQPQARPRPRVEPDAEAEAQTPEWSEDAPVPPGGSDPDDLVVLDRVKTEIFRPGDAEKGSVNVSVENGVVYLRGDVDDPAQAEFFEVAAAEVEGVVRVENLIGT
jgi:hypothetical protein